MQTAVAWLGAISLTGLIVGGNHHSALYVVTCFATVDVLRVVCLDVIARLNEVLAVGTLMRI